MKIPTNKKFMMSLLLCLSVATLNGVQTTVNTPQLPSEMGKEFNKNSLGSPQQPLPQLSPDDLKMLEEVEKEINKFVESLPPEEQQKFWTDVDELSKAMSDMKEDELLEFMEKAFQDQAPTNPLTPSTQPTSLPTKEEPVIEQKPTIPSDKQQAAIQLIDTLIVTINKFLGKTQTIIELPSKIPSWVKEGKLRGWPSALTWGNFKAQIQEFEQKLNKLKERDAKSKHFKYLDDFIKDETLYNNISKIKDALVRHEAKIEISSFGVDKMSHNSRQAIRDVLLNLLEATTILAIPANLDKIFEKYEPTAKKLKEAEEAKQKQAIEQSKKPRYPSTTTIGGLPARQRPGERNLDLLRGGGRHETPTFTAPSKDKEKGDEKGEKPESKGGPAGGGAKDKKDEKKDEKKKREEDKRSEELVKEFGKSLESFLIQVENNPHLEQFEKHIKDASSVDADLIKAISSAKDSIGTANGHSRALKRRIKNLNAQQKNDYRKDIQIALNDYKKEIDALIGQIDKAASFNPQGSTNNKIKYYNYFGGANRDDLEKTLNDLTQRNGAKAEIDKIQKTLDNASPINANDLKDRLIELQKLVREV